MKGALFVAACAVLFAAGDAAAQPSPTPSLASAARARVTEAPATGLSLEAVRASVERSYPLLEAARRDVEAADFELTSAQGGFDPLVRVRGGVTAGGYYQYGRADAVVEVPTPLWGTTFFAGWRVSAGNVPAYYGNLETNAYGELRVGAQVPLWRNGPIDRRRANIERAELGRPVAALTLAQQRIETFRAATLRYWEWAASGRRVAIARTLLATALQREAGLQARVERGDLPAFERAENARAVAQRRGNLVAAERALAQASIELSLFLRGPDGAPRLPTEQQLPGALPEPDAVPRVVSDGVREAQSRRPELRRLEAQRGQFRVERDWARNQAAPAVDLVVSGSQDIGPGDTRRERPELDASVLVEVPILTRAATGRARVAEAGMARVDAQLRLAADRVEADVRDAHSALVAAVERLGAVRVEISVARQLEALERSRFELGEGTLLIVNLREQATAEAELREVEALAEYHRAVAAWTAALALDAGTPPGR